MAIENILSIIGVTGTAQRVLLELFANGPQTATFLAKKLSLPRPSIYDALHVLEKQSLVVSQEENGKSVFSVTNPEHIAQALNTSAEKIDEAQNEFAKIIPSLLNSPHVTE